MIKKSTPANIVLVLYGYFMYPNFSNCDFMIQTLVKDNAHNIPKIIITNQVKIETVPRYKRMQD